MERINRRRLLQLSGGGALAAGPAASPRSSPRGERPPSPRAPRSIGSGVPIMCRSPTRRYRTKILEQCQKDLGIKFNLETVDGLTIQARVTSAVSSGTGPDIISSINNWAQLYAESVADVSDVAEEIGKAQGGYYETSKAIAYDGKKWLAVPNTIVGLQIVNRASWWNEIGYGPEKYPETWEEWRDGRQEAEGQGASARSDAGARLWRRERVLVPVSLVVGRQGGRSRRQDRRAEQQGDGRVGQVRGRLLEGRLRRWRLRVGRFRQQPRLSLRHDQRHQ